METIHQLREKLQGDKFASRKDIWGYRYLRRGISIYITRLLIPTRITPNQVTVAMIVCGVGAAAAIFYSWLWLGFALAYANIVLDAVDGELARYRKAFSLRGIYLDRINHLVVPGLFVLSLTLHVANTPWVLGFGLLSAFCMPIVLSAGYLHYQIDRVYQEHAEHVVLPHAAAQAHMQSANPLRGLLRAVGQLRQFVIVVLVCALGYGAEIFFALPEYSILNWIVLLYGILFVLYGVREITQGYYSIEARVANLHNEKR